MTITSEYIDYLDAQIRIGDFVIYYTGSSSSVSMSLAQVGDIHIWEPGVPRNGWRSLSTGTFKKSQAYPSADEKVRLELRVWKDGSRKYDPREPNRAPDPDGRTRSVVKLKRVVVVPRPEWVENIQNAGLGV